GADLSRLVREEMGPYQTSDGDRITTNGPSILVEPSAAQTVAVGIHELATNAAKYGALSTPTGTIKLDWKIVEDCFELPWEENGGPKTSPPTTSGIGTRIIVGTIEQQFGGRVHYDWGTNGLVCLLIIPH